MASLMCSNCGNGIHYHDEPDGTQYYVFPAKIWNKLISSELWISRYILDGTDEYLSVWKCRECDAIHIFRADDTNLYAAFVRKYEATDIVPEQEEYIALSDYDWELITEKRIKGRDLPTMFPDIVPLLCYYKDDMLYICAKDGVASVYSIITQQQIKPIA